MVNMENRIEINGVWYVREDAINDSLDHLEAEELYVTDSLVCSWENDNWLFEAFVIMKDGAETLTDHYTDPYLTITDKRVKGRENWREHTVDNPSWMKGVLENNTDSLSEASEFINQVGLKHLKVFLNHLVNKGWLV
jgi:hypothetical protein